MSGPLTNTSVHRMYGCQIGSKYPIVQRLGVGDLGFKAAGEGGHSAATANLAMQEARASPLFVRLSVCGHAADAQAGLLSAYLWPRPLVLLCRCGHLMNETCRMQSALFGARTTLGGHAHSDPVWQPSCIDRGPFGPCLAAMHR
jgi:hypothetical protein